MNDRIKELIQQMEWEEVGADLYGKTFDGCMTGEALQKFAELIVQECVQTLIDKTPEWYTNEASEEDWDKGYDRAMKDCVHHIQEHFGVGE